MVRRRILLPGRTETDRVVVFLAPLDQPALEIVLRLGQFFERQVFAEEAVDEQPVDEIVSLIEVDRTHHRFERIAEDVLLRQRIAAPVENDVTVETDLAGDRVERLARNDFRPELGHESFVAVGEFDVKVVRRDGFDHGVAQIFEPFVVDLPSVLQNQRS